MLKCLASIPFLNSCWFVAKSSEWAMAHGWSFIYKSDVIENLGHNLEKKMLEKFEQMFSFKNWTLIVCVYIEIILSGLLNIILW